MASSTPTWRRAPRPLLRVAGCVTGDIEYEVPQHAYVFWEEPGLVRLVERDPRGAITFLHEVRLELAFLATG